MPGELFGNLFFGLAAAPVPQLRQFMRVSLARHNLFDDRHSGSAVDIGHSSMDSYIHLIETFLHAPQPVARFRRKDCFVPHQSAQHTHLLGGPERPAQQPAAM